MTDAQKITPRKRQLGPGPGRPKGVPNKATIEAKAMARRIVEDEEYQENLLRRMRRGTAGAIETILWHYGYGKPKDESEGGGGNKTLVLAGLSPELLRQLAMRFLTNGDSDSSAA